MNRHSLHSLTPAVAPLIVSLPVANVRLSSTWVIILGPDPSLPSSADWTILLLLLLTLTLLLRLLLRLLRLLVVTPCSASILSTSFVVHAALLVGGGGGDGAAEMLPRRRRRRHCQSRERALSLSLSLHSLSQSLPRMQFR